MRSIKLNGKEEKREVRIKIEAIGIYRLQLKLSGINFRRMNMKNVVRLMALFFVLSFPVIASAGSAYIPLIIVNGATGSRTDYTQTVLQVTNISTVDQKVDITLFKNDGTFLNLDLENFSYACYMGGISCTLSSTVTGTYSISLGAKKMLQLTLLGNNSDYMGYGLITGTITSAQPFPTTALIANAFIRDSDPSSTSNIYQRVITINGGNPF